MTVVSAYVDQVQKAYIAYYGRPADPGGLDYWTNRLSAVGGDWATVIDAFGNSAEATTLLEGMDLNGKVNQLYQQLLSRDADPEGLIFYVNGIGEGTFTLASVAVNILNGIAATGADHDTITAKLDSANLFTENMDTTPEILAYNADTVDTIRTWMHGITTTPADQTAVENTLASIGQVFTLTNGTDTGTANIFSAPQVYTPGGNDYINSLQNEDNLTGSGTNPTLNVVLGSPNDASEAMISPILNGIETMNIQVTGDGIDGINFQDATGLQNLNITRVTAINADILMEDMKETTDTLGLSNSTHDGTVEFNYAEGQLEGVADTVGITLNHLQMAGLTLSQGTGNGDAVEDEGYGFETINATAATTTNLDQFVIGANTREQADHGTEQTVNMVADGTLEINDLQATGAEHITLAANATVMIAADEHEVLAAANDGITTTQMQDMTVTGDSNVTIDGLDGDDDGFTFDASALTGDLTLGVVESGNLAAIILSGTGDDEIAAYNDLGADVTTGDGADAVTVTGDMLVMAGEDSTGPDYTMAAASITTGEGDDEVTVTGDMTADTDDTTDSNELGNVGHTSIDTGAGDDTVTVGALQSAIDWDHNVLNDGNVDDLMLMAAATIDTGAGDDTVTTNELAENCLVSTGEGADDMTVMVEAATILAGDNLDDQEVDIDGVVDTLGAVVDLGAGDDTILFTDETISIDDGLNAYTLVGAGAEVRGGEGTNLFNVETVDQVTVAAATFYNDADDFDTAELITGFQTANFTILNAVDAPTEILTGVDQNDNEDVGATSITADVMRFDDALATINLDSQEAPILQDPSLEIYEEGNDTSFELNNLRAGITVNLTAQEASGVDGDGYIADDETIDVALDVDYALADATAHDDSFALNVTDGSGSFDLDLSMNATANTLGFDNDDSTTDDNDLAIENVTINLADGQSHFIDMNGFGDSQHTETISEGSRTVETSLTIATTTDGTDIHVIDTDADTISITGAADVHLEVNAANNYEITTGSGDDIIDMAPDDVRAENPTDDPADAVAGDTVDEADYIDAGEGRDRVIVNGTDNLGSTVLATDDDVFENIASVEELEVDTDTAAGVQEIVMDEAAQVTNVDSIFFTGSGAQDTSLTIGENFENDLTIDASAHDAALTLTIDSQDTDEDTNLIDMDIALNLIDGTTLTFDDTGDTSAAIAITAIVVDDAVTNIGDGVAGAGTNGQLDLNVAVGTVDSLTLVDGNDAADNAITVTVSNAWGDEDHGLTIDASDITDDDDDTTTGGAFIDGDAETDAALTIMGTQNDDVINDGEGADTITGNAGDDTITAETGNDNLSGGAGDDTLSGGLNNDTIDGGTGADTITGGIGADTLTGGTGADTFVYEAVAESNGDDTDTITDFLSGTDTIQVAYDGTGGDDIINLGSFQTVSSLGAGDNSLLGTVAVPVIGDYFYSTDENQLVIDVDGDGDITSDSDYAIISTNTITAADIEVVIDAGAGDDLIRMSQGSDVITGGAGLDTFVIVGALTQSDVSNYIAAGDTIQDAVEDVVTYNELLSTRSGTEANAGDVINGGVVDIEDVLQVFGTANLTTINDGDNLGVATLFSHSTVTLTTDQLFNLSALVFDGNTPHTIIITDVDGDPLSNADQITALDAANVYLTNTGGNTTFTIGTGAVITLADFIADHVDPLLDLSVADAMVLNSGVPYNLLDTPANLVAADAAILDNATDITANAAVTVAQATTIEDAVNIGVNTYNISDSALNLAASSNAVLALAGTVTANTAATAAQATTIAAFAKAVVYGISDNAAAIAAAAGAALNEATTITVTGTATVAQATTIEAATNSGANTYNISDSALNLAASSNAVLTLAGTVTANTAATAAQATTMAAFAKAVVYGVSDTATNLAGAVGAGLNEATTLAATTAATVAEATIIDAATNSGANTYNVSDTAAAIAGAAAAAMNGAVNITATGQSTVAQATTLKAFTNSGTETYSLTDNIAALTGMSAAVNTGATTTTLNLNNADDISASDTAAMSVDAITFTADADATMTVAQHAQITAAAGDNTVTIASADLTTVAVNAAVESYVLGDDTAGDAIAVTGVTGAQNVSAAQDAITVNVSGTYTGTLVGAGVDDVLVLATAANIAGATVGAAFDNLTLASGGSATMTATQHESFNGTLSVAGANTITLSGAGAAVTAMNDVENYDLGTLGRTFTVNAGELAVNVISGGVDTIAVGANTVTGTYTLGATDTITMTAGGNIAGVNAAAATGAGTVSIAGATTMTTAQHNGFATAINAVGGADQITLTTAGTVTGDADVETYVLTATSGNDFTLGAAGQILTLAVAAGADSLRLGALAVTGTVTNLGATDTIYTTTGSDISAMAGAVLGTLNLTGAITMTEAQYDPLAGIDAAGGADQVTIKTGAITSIAVDADVETYVIQDDTGDDGVAVTGITGAQIVNASACNDVEAVTFSVSGTYTGTLTGDNAGGTDDVISLATGANISAATVTNVADLTLANDASVTMTALQLAAFNTVVGAGAETITLSSAAAGTAIGATQTAIENIVLSSSAVDTVTVTTGVAGAFGGTINLSGGGADVITLTNAGIALADAVKTTVSNFNVSGVDQIISLGGASSWQNITVADSLLTIAQKGVVEIASSFGELINPTNLDGGAAETLIAAAIGDDTSLAAGQDFTAILYGIGNAYIYQVDATAADGTMATGDIVVELVATLTGITADSLTSANFA